VPDEIEAPVPASPRTPAYLRIERYLWSLIADGQGVTTALPGEVELAQQFGVSVMTVRQAYNQLVNAGAVVRVRAKGTFAVPHLTDDLGSMTGHSYPKNWKEQAADVSSEVLQYDVREAPEHICTVFRCPKGSPLTYLERIRYANDQPVAWDTRWMQLAVHERADESTFERLSVFEALELVGVRTSTMESEISALEADPRHSKVLRCPVNSALLVRTFRCTNTDGEITLTGTSLYPARRFSFRSTTVLSELHFDAPSDDSLD
jgi:GntR family transcriptional regulator